MSLKGSLEIHKKKKIFGNTKEVNTYPCLDWAIVISLVEDNVEKEKHEKDGVIGEDSLATAEPPIIGDVEPGAEYQDPGSAVTHGLHQKKRHVHCCQGVPFSSVSKWWAQICNFINKLDITQCVPNRVEGSGKWNEAEQNGDSPRIDQLLPVTAHLQCHALYERGKDEHSLKKNWENFF